jgi:hypothetical protein
MMDEKEWQVYRRLVRIARLAYRMREASKLFFQTRDEGIRKLHGHLSAALDIALAEVIRSHVLDENLWDGEKGL